MRLWWKKQQPEGKHRRRGGLVDAVLDVVMGEWESHPCTLPTDVNIVHLNQVFACDCGRRWQLLSYKAYRHGSGEIVVYEMKWIELEPVFPVSDEDISKFLDEEAGG